jgi:hypothetical protein
MPVSRSACHAIEVAVRTFSTSSRPACGRPPAAAVLGRAATQDSGSSACRVAQRCGVGIRRRVI